MIGVMSILRDISEGVFSYVDSTRVLQARRAINKGLKMILKTQIRVEGKLTAWCAQYDPINLKPAGARSYEPPSISGAESVGVVKYLMGIDNPNAEVIHSVKSGIEWFNQVKITGIRVIKKEDTSLPKGYDLIVEFDTIDSIPLWARFYEMDTNNPMFLGRDGIVKYSLAEIEYERRVGYRWLGDWAKSLINEEYLKWTENRNIK
jgi:PelA/Pel-15E family pectate lyase